MKVIVPLLSYLLVVLVMLRIEIDNDAAETGRRMIIYSRSRKRIDNDKYFYTSMRRDWRDIFVILFLNLRRCDKMTKNLEWTI